jgi:hypothetical protein
MRSDQNLAGNHEALPSQVVRLLASFPPPINRIHCAPDVDEHDLDLARIGTFGMYTYSFSLFLFRDRHDCSVDVRITRVFLLSIIGLVQVCFLSCSFLFLFLFSLTAPASRRISATHCLDLKLKLLFVAQFTQAGTVVNSAMS